MIYTLTLNPSIDYIVGIQDFQFGKTNRTSFEQKYPGGKGINVSRVLKELGIESTALGFIGGFTGVYIEETLETLGIETDFVRVDDDSRINIKLKGNVETEINGQGPIIKEDKIKQLKNQLKNLTDTDVVILSGSKLRSLSENFYEELIEMIKKSSAEFIIDTNAGELLNILKYQPLLIKPNKEELEDLFGVEIGSSEEVIPYGKQLIEKGAQHVIISLGEEGAYLFTKEEILFGEAPAGQLVNSVGAGDSMIAGFVAEWTKSNNVIEAFKMGLAAGSATAFNEDLARREDILRLVEKVQLKN